MSDWFVKLGVQLIVGIKQVELYTSHIYAPNISVNLIVSVRNFYHQWIALFVKLTFDGECTEVLRLIISNLLSVHRQALCKISEAIQEANGTHIYIRIRCLFHIVAGKHTKTTTIYLQRRMDTILHAEISHRRTFVIGLYVHILTEHVVNVFDALHQSFVLHNFLFASICQTFQQHHRIMIHFMIDFRVKVAEQVARLKIPYPPHVVCNLVQTLQFFRQRRLNCQNSP